MQKEFYSEINRIVKIENGLLKGAKGNNPIFTVFKGIPYAKPPVGKLRWKAPAPMDNWDGIYEAKNFSKIAYQAKFEKDSLYGKEFFQNTEAQSEDMLYLNIWTPDTTGTKKLPVLFWIHGGGMSHGYGHEPEFDGEGFCAEGAILVTFNYRVGLFGHFACTQLAQENKEGLAGNYSHLDQIAALKWVRRNIPAFGGDPDNITIFGQSAGSGSVQILMNCPQSEDDIAKVIINSAVRIDAINDRYRKAHSPMKLEEVLSYGDAFMERAGCNSIDEMRKKSYEELISIEGHDTFRAVIDKYVIHDLVSNHYYNNSYPKIPYMLGCNYTEGIDIAPKTTEQFEDFVKETMKEKAEGCLASANIQTTDDYQKILAEVHPRLVASRVFAELEIKQGRDPAYIYMFDRDLPGDERGSFHSSELWYVFSTLYRCWRPMEGIDYDISKQMCKAWANFARNGNPNGEGVPNWSPYTRDSTVFMRFCGNSAQEEYSDHPAQLYLMNYALGES